MVAKFSIADGEYSSLKTDFDGDGGIDLEQSLDGDVIEIPPDRYTYDDLKSAIKNLHLNQKYEKSILLKVYLAEFLSKKSNTNKVIRILESKTLESIIKELHKYYLKGIISEREREVVGEIITNLI